MVVTEFQYIFATYFYREEFTGPRFRHFADSVDIGLRRSAKGDKTERTDSKKATMRTELTSVDVSFTHGEIGVLMRKGQDDLLVLVNAVIAQMKADGTLRQLHEKYGLVYGYE